jgi:hypothetical protein
MRKFSPMKKPAANFFAAFFYKRASSIEAPAGSGVAYGNFLDSLAWFVR